MSRNALARRTFGSRGLAARLWKLNREALGDEHPATRAALGRLRAHRGDVPQRDSATPESIAWHRESKAIPGFLNRRHRRHLAERFPVDSCSSVSTVEAQ